MCRGTSPGQAKEAGAAGGGGVVPEAGASWGPTARPSRTGECGGLRLSASRRRQLESLQDSRMSTLWNLRLGLLATSRPWVSQNV